MIRNIARAVFHEPELKFAHLPRSSVAVPDAPACTDAAMFDQSLLSGEKFVSFIIGSPINRKLYHEMVFTRGCHAAATQAV